MNKFLKRSFSFFIIFMMIISMFTCSFANAINGNAETDVNGVNIGFGLGAEGLETNIINKDGNTTTNEILAEGGNLILTEYKTLILGVSGIAALTFIIFFIINFVKFSSSAGNPQMRSHAMNSLIWCGIGCAGCGGVALFFAIFYGFGSGLSF